MSDNWVLERLMLVIPLVLSLSVHEWAHAYSAFRLGDDTALRMGRLTLNPIAHIDPIGTLLLPMMGVPFGWAKPVPVNPMGFNRKIDMRKGMMITASAGPASNVVLAVLCTVGFYIAVSAGMRSQDALVTLLIQGVVLNVVLAVFNMLPIYPLDGSRVADGLMPRKWRPLWDRFARLGPIALLAVIFMPRMLGFSLLDWPVRITYGVLSSVYGLAIG